MEQDTQYQKAYDKALRLISMRSHSVFELKNKLTSKGYGKELLDKLINDLIDKKYLDDESFASNYLDNLIKYKAFGFYGLKAKLMQRGIDKGLIDSLLGNLSLADEKKIALKFLGKKKEVDPIKLARSLGSKGFRSEVIGEILRNQS